MTRLEPCPHCHRHVRVNETACPFCARPVAFASAPRVTPRARVGRAAMFAFGVAASSQAGCGDNLRSHPDASISADAPPDDGLDAGVVPIYAAAPTKDSGTKSSG
jgi:hypothetical protein